MPVKVLGLNLNTFLHFLASPAHFSAKDKGQPLISCICVTKARPILLERSIKRFQAQTWPHKELVILYEDDDHLTREYLATVCDTNIKVIEMRSHPRLTLGELRNIAIRASRGAFFCQWDDDDWCHPERLSVQWAYLRGNRAHACLLNQWLIFDNATKRAYVSSEYTWEGSILCDRRALSRNIKYKKLNRGEDTSFVKSLAKRYRIALLSRPYLYIYVYHGSNTWDRAYWESSIFTKSPLQLSDFFSFKLQEILEGKVSDEVAVKVLRSIHMITREQHHV